MRACTKLGRPLAAAAAAGFVFLLVPGTAHAAEKCTDMGSPAAQEIELGNSGETKAGLMATFLLGLNPPTFPAEDIGKIANPCERTTFTVGGDAYTVHGGDRDQPPRWAASVSKPERVAYIALVPRPAPALDWFHRYEKDNNAPANFNTGADMMFALAVTAGLKREIYAYYDKIPDDAHLTDAMCKALAGGLVRFATWNVETLEADFTPRPASAAPGTCGMN
jgi:hypothetical protein